MAKIKFDFTKNDMYDYLSNRFKLKTPKSNKKEQIQKDDKEIELENLTSMSTKSKQIERNITKKATLLILIVPILIFFIVVLYKTYRVIQNQSNRKIPKKIEKEANFDLKVDQAFKWRVLKDQEVNNLSHKIVIVQKNIKKDMNKTINMVSKKIDESNNFVKKQVQDLKNVIQNTQEVTSENIKAIRKKQVQLEKKITDASRVSSYKEKNKDFANISLPKLPPLKNYKKTQSVNNENVKKNDKVKKGSEQKKQVIQYETESASVEQNTINYSTINLKKKQKKKSNLPTFTLMPGFVKGVLINGGEVPAMLDGSSEPTPIFIRLTGDELIANDDSMNIDGCLVLATAKGDLSKQAVDIRLSKISCNLSDLYGNKYKLSQKIEGWVFGENGSYGIPGRLISRAGKIIKAGLPLSMVEAMINGLNNAISNSLNKGSTLIGSNTSPTPSAGVMQGINNGSNAVLKKFSDYYLKMLEILNPSISIRAGRKVVIAFKGGETLKLKKYKPITTSYFDNNSLKGVYNEK